MKLLLKWYVVCRICYGHQPFYYHYYYRSIILQVSSSLACGPLLVKARPILRPAFSQVSSLICSQVSQETITCVLCWFALSTCK